ncbi:MAG: hypothetical protein GTO45_19575 [Candidatus Aminicenantes bacterium]|nr:hypothetical protein [Candidatus Aminicenantes bacterium]NIN44144.1 hypothetical protein [Candidatus Aminicenantes bacterium]NIN86962.1 hypothetical protein [Candidatus Aminicenantes bacterium]NIR11104.1 hypothetical protein [Candidatus Aminicenantes bacterium]NIT28673.1 hypothetical protein [Candidatus Aminicenantes bacterium]
MDTTLQKISASKIKIAFVYKGNIEGAKFISSYFNTMGPDVFKYHPVEAIPGPFKSISDLLKRIKEKNIERSI